ncbi:MAG: peptidylprolyl isomerase, partial [Pseudomonadota bacterium]
MLNSFRSKGRGTGTNIVVWALLGLLMVGLTGLGLGGAVSSLSGQNVASIDGEPVPRDAFVRQLFRQLDAFGQQTGQRPTVQQARAFGLDQQVLTQMIGRAAVDAQARGMGLSVPDTMVRDALIENPSFSGLSGGFDAESYEFFLNRQGMTAREFEEELRTDLTRALVQAGVSGGLAMPRAGAEAILAWQGEQRSIRAVEFTREGLEPPADPDDATLMAYWEEHPELYTLPETRIVSYVVLRPDDLAGEIEIGEEALRAAYDARADSYDQPERRMVDVIGFADMAAAEAAKAAIEAGETTFGDIASVRGLSAADLSLGAVARGGVASGARDAVFGLEEPGVAGPAMGDLGPSLFRVNAILPARSTSFEEAREDLATELAAVEAAQDLIGWYEPVEDLLAGGATLEEIAEETPLAFAEIGDDAGRAGVLLEQRRDGPGGEFRSQRARPGDR